jgi:hypothetical protein
VADVVPAEQPVEEQPLAMAVPADYRPLFSPESEDDAFITGPSMRPDEPVTAGIPSGGASIPAAVIRNLPLLQRAAQEPGADPKLQTLVALVLRELGRRE